MLPLSASAAAALSGAAGGGEASASASATVWAALVGACLGGLDTGLLGSADAMEADGSSAASSLGPEGGPALLPLPGSAPSAAVPRLLLLPPLRPVGNPSAPAAASFFDPLAVVDLVKACDVLLLVADASALASSSNADASAAGVGDGEDGAPLVDAAGEAALSVARALGAPLAIGVAVLSSGPSSSRRGATNDLKHRAAAKKRLAAALERHLPGREPRIAVLGSPSSSPLASSSSSDASALARTIADAHAPPPPWRRQRPSLLIERASFVEGGEGGGGEVGGGKGEGGVKGELTLRCHVRGGAGLAAASLVHVPGCGDFQIGRILAAPAPRCGRAGGERERKGNSSSTGTAAMEGTTAVLASVPAEEREPLVREAAADAGAAAGATDNGESFPAVEDMAAVEYALAAAAAGLPEQQRAARAARKLPAGTSEYQAAWLLDDDDEAGSSDGDDGGDEGEEGDFDDEFGGNAALPPLTPLPPALQRKMDAAGGGWGGGGGGGAEEGGSAGSSDDDRADDDRDGAATFAGTDDESDFDADDDGAATTVGGQEQSASLKAAWRDQAEDARFPDEVDTPMELPARLRFSKYRGLKSWRASRWSPADGAPPEFRRVFAFEAPKRARRRAVALAASAGSGSGGAVGVASGSRVDVVLCGVPAPLAEKLVAAVEASMGRGGSSPSPSSVPSSYPPPPVVATGLLQHEGRLSVMHWAVRKSTSFDAPLRSKDELLFVDGVRRFATRPIFSGDDHGASHFKLERFLQPGRACVASSYAPIAHGPLPLLAFRRVAGGGGGGESSAPWQLAAAGGVRGADPDRVVLKKVVLSGYPVKVHKRKAVVRWMFHDPADVRWFRPVELWSKGGRRGRIKEPVGTHGAMKCMFDGAMSQADGVCLSLYKRQAPKWPPGEDLWVG